LEVLVDKEITKFVDRITAQAGKIYLAFAPGAVSSGLEGAATRMASLNDLHVLLVDDNRQMRLLLRNMLRATGIGRITEAETAYEAFAWMRRGPVDIILADWKMEPVDGLTFTRMVRQSPDSPNPYATILMLTAHTEISRVAAARDAGVNGFLRKPISAALLFERLNSALVDARSFIRTDGFFGPDRRFGASPSYGGPWRRMDDAPRAGFADTLDLDEFRLSA
jgi:CheY-like chemotaxis protein